MQAAAALALVNLLAGPAAGDAGARQPAAVQAQSSTAAPPSSPSPSDRPSASAQEAPTDNGTYDALLARLMGGDRTVDFTELRMAYTQSAGFNPMIPMMVYRPLWAAIAARNTDEALRIANSLLDKNFVEVNAHMVAAMAYTASGNPERAEFHRFMADGLLASIRSSGDGRTPATAFRVISIGEEYGLLVRAMGFRPVSQSIVIQDGHTYDRLTMTDPRSSMPAEFLFNVDRFYGWKPKPAAPTP